MSKVFIEVNSDVLDSINAKMASIEARLDAVRMLPVPEWITATEYAKQIGVTRRTVTNWIAKGEIESSRRGKTLLIRPNPAA